MRPEPSSDPDPEESPWLDEDHYLEPVRADGPVDPHAPVLKDARGRLWRVRRRPPSWSAILGVLAVAIALALIAVVWLGA